jgi:hypothetical protein
MHSDHCISARRIVADNRQFEFIRSDFIPIALPDPGDNARPNRIWRSGSSQFRFAIPKE